MMQLNTRIPRYLGTIMTIALLYCVMGSLSLIQAQSEFQAVVTQLESQLQPKNQGDIDNKKKAFADKLAKVDGIKNFHIATMDETSKTSPELIQNLVLSLKSILVDRWQSIVKVQSAHSKELVCVYMREAEQQEVELFLVNVEDGEALVVNFQADLSKLDKILENRQLFMN